MFGEEQRKKIAFNNASANRTGGGPPETIMLDEVEKQVVLTFCEEQISGIQGIDSLMAERSRSFTSSQPRLQANSVQSFVQRLINENRKQLRNNVAAQRPSTPDTEPQSPISMLQISGTETTSQVCGAESTWQIPGGESTWQIPSGESTWQISGGESTWQILGSESTSQITGGESTWQIPGGESTWQIPGGESTWQIPSSESTSQITGGESTSQIPGGESQTPGA
ncbi:hypothetical protein WMY93_018382 [Mugilogobius chulae]|uniref:Uncharacterized protein n=1 Tax=Mugilogobius chulae TaxID=88201 RepID=A0AAW0NLG2_9GOBI